MTGKIDLSANSMETPLYILHYMSVCKGEVMFLCQAQPEVSAEQNPTILRDSLSYPNPFHGMADDMIVASIPLTWLFLSQYKPWHSCGTNVINLIKYKFLNMKGM